MKVIELKQDSDVKETIQDALDKSEHIETVMIITINKDGTQFLNTSTMSGYQKMFLAQFVQSWASRWFSEQYDV